ncbi:MAG: prohibitin family protein [Saprospiraceae bacterium]
MNPQKLNFYLIAGVAALVLLFTLGSSSFLTIEAGEAGVLFQRFSGGLDKANIYPPGFHLVAPWNTMFIYEVREQQIAEKMEVLSSNGLTIVTDVTVRVAPQQNRIGELHETFGEDYANRLIKPEIRSAVREVIGRYTPEELYSTKRAEVTTSIQDGLAKALGDNYVNLKATLIRDIELPDRVQAAIEEKIEAEQKAQRYVFLLAQERKEAERKIIEAEAKAESNRILTASLNDRILQDKGIEATLQLALSPNSKVVVIGGSDGLPLILNN